MIYRISAAIERKNTKEIVENIHSQKLTITDVNGEHLPPEPDAKLKDATLIGIDVNNIRNPFNNFY